jgi:hypothetical protein
VNTASTSLVIYQFSYGPAKPTRQQYILTTAGQRNGFTPVAAKQTNITNQTADKQVYHFLSSWEPHGKTETVL